MTKHKIVLSLFVMGLMLIPSHAVNAKTILFENFENDLREKGWELSGLWHRQENPEEVFVQDPEINPELVDLPEREAGLLPAKGRDSILWYGDESNGTFITPYDESKQTEQNGGLSTEAHEGTAVTPAIDLTDAENARMSFWYFFGVEGVDVDRYDLMTVDVSTNDGTTWTEIHSLNPVDDVDSEAYYEYTSEGLSEPLEWAFTTLDLADYTGKTIKLRFNFRTIDERYNAFRGWGIDKLRVEDKAPKRPGKKGITKRAKEYCGGVKNGEITKPVHFAVHDEQRVTVRSRRAKWFITPYGKDTKVKKRSKKRGTVYLNDGTYTLWVVRKTDKECPKGKRARATVEKKGSADQKTVHTKAIVNIHAKNLVAKSVVKVRKNGSDGKYTAIKTRRVVDRNRVQLLMPNLGSEGLYDVKIETPGDKSRVITKAFRFVKDKAPTITSVSPKSLSDKETTKVTIKGKNFTDGAVATVGGFPLLDTTVTARKITGTLPTGGSPGFHNVVVMNPNGQQGRKIGAARIQDKSKEGYKPGGDLVTPPSRVENVAAEEADSGVLVTWDVVDNVTVDHYTVIVRSEGEVVKKVEATDANRTIAGLDSGTDYSVSVRAVGEYRGGPLSTAVNFTKE